VRNRLVVTIGGEVVVVVLPIPLVSIVRLVARTPSQLPRKEEKWLS